MEFWVVWVAELKIIMLSLVHQVNAPVLTVRYKVIFLVYLSRRDSIIFYRVILFKYVSLIGAVKALKLAFWTC